MSKKEQYEKRGVKLIEGSQNTIFECLACGRRWAALIQRGGRLPRGYWKCPEGCNHDDLRYLSS